MRAAPRTSPASAWVRRLNSTSCCRAAVGRSFSSTTVKSSTSSSTSSPSPTTSSAATPPPPPSAGFASLPSRRLISVSGPDAAKFLQGVITASVASPDATPRTQGFYAAFLTAHSRVLFDVFIYPDFLGLGKKSPAGELPPPGTSFLVEVDAGRAQALAKHIRRYKVRAKLETRILDEGEAGVWQVWNDASGTGSASQEAPAVGTALDGPGLLKDPRAPGLGYRLIQGGDAAPALDLDRSTEEAYAIRRYLRGVPEGQSEILHDQALPQESNLDFMGGIDFRKGCYVGQELTIRTKHRGVVRKRVLPCLLYGEDEPVPTRIEYAPRDGANHVQAQSIPGEAKIEAVNKRARGPGKWLAGYGNLGLALCRLETMTDVPGLPGTTYKEGDEFKVEWNEQSAQGGGNGEAEAEAKGETEGLGEKRGIKVKALVPDWLRAELDAVAAAQQSSQQQQHHD